MSIERTNLGDLLAAIAAKTPTPGGGAVASVVAALAAALAAMVVNYSAGKKSLATHAALHVEALGRLEGFRVAALQLAEEDAVAYARLNELMKLPEGDSRRQRELSGAVDSAIAAPRGVMITCGELLNLLSELTDTTNRALRSDLAIAAILAEAALRAAAWNVRVNLSLVDRLNARQQLVNKLDADLSTAHLACQHIESRCGSPDPDPPAPNP